MNVCKTQVSLCCCRPAAVARLTSLVLTLAHGVGYQIQAESAGYRRAGMQCRNLLRCLTVSKSNPVPVSLATVSSSGFPVRVPAKSNTCTCQLWRAKRTPVTTCNAGKQHLASDVCAQRQVYGGELCAEACVCQISAVGVGQLVCSPQLVVCCWPLCSAAVISRCAPPLCSADVLS